MTLPSNTLDEVGVRSCYARLCLGSVGFQFLSPDAIETISLTLLQRHEQLLLQRSEPVRVRCRRSGVHVVRRGRGRRRGRRRSCPSRLPRSTRGWRPQLHVLHQLYESSSQRIHVCLRWDTVGPSRKRAWRPPLMALVSHRVQRVEPPCVGPLRAAKTSKIF